VVQICLVVDQVGDFVIQRLDGNDIVTIEVDTHCLRDQHRPSIFRKERSVQNPIGSLPGNQEVESKTK